MGRLLDELKFRLWAFVAGLVCTAALDPVLPVVSGSFQAIENTVCYVLTKFSNRMHNVEQSQAASAFAVLESDIGSGEISN